MAVPENDKVTVVSVDKGEGSVATMTAVPPFSGIGPLFVDRETVGPRMVPVALAPLISTPICMMIVRPGVALLESAMSVKPSPLKSL